jgi:hypothetical protein
VRPDVSKKLDIEQFDTILDASDPNFRENLLAAMGLKPGDSIEITGPQFEREDGITPSVPDAWNKLHLLPVETLKAIGCRPWEEKEDGDLMLFPYEWYDHIPNGLQVMDICGGVSPFVRGKTDDDYRFGVLSFGVFCPKQPVKQ